MCGAHTGGLGAPVPRTRATLNPEPQHPATTTPDARFQSAWPCGHGDWGACAAQPQDRWRVQTGGLCHPLGSAQPWIEVASLWCYDQMDGKDGHKPRAGHTWKVREHHETTDLCGKLPGTGVQGRAFLLLLPYSPILLLPASLCSHTISASAAAAGLPSAMEGRRSRRPRADPQSHSGRHSLRATVDELLTPPQASNPRRSGGFVQRCSNSDRPRAQACFRKGEGLHCLF